MDRREKLEEQQLYYKNQAKKMGRIAQNSLDKDNQRIFQFRADENAKKADEIAKKLSKSIVKSDSSGIISIEPFSRYLNSSDKLFEYSRKVKPIAGYEDVFIHGDKNGFALRDKDGNEHTYLTPREFAVLLKEDPNYNGGNIRLFACETGADGAVAAKALAIQLGVDVLAPSDIIWNDFEGNYIIGPDKYTNSGRWIKYTPYEKE